MPRLHIFPTSLVIEPSRTESGRVLWIDREKNTIEANDRPIADLEKAQTHFIDGVAGIIKCVPAVECGPLRACFCCLVTDAQH